MTIREESAESSMLIATVSNPSSRELSIPGFECGAGFWNSVIKIPVGQTRELRLPVPRSVTCGDRYTVVVVYGGLGASLREEDRKKVSPKEWTRHPDVSLNCRKMETEVNLDAK